MLNFKTKIKVHVKYKETRKSKSNKYTNISTDANNGPTTGIHEYCQSVLPLLDTLIIWWTILGDKSLAGLIAYPVVPPNDIPITATTKPTTIGTTKGIVTKRPTATIAISNTKVPTISIKKLKIMFLFDGPVACIAKNLLLNSSGSFKLVSLTCFQ